MLCAKFGWKCPCGSGEEDFKEFSMMDFYYFAIISTLSKAWPFIWKNKLESSYPRIDALCQVWLEMALWIWRRFLQVLNVFLLYPMYLPFEKGVTLHMNKIEIPLPKNALCQVWLKLTQWFWSRRVFKVFNVFSLFPNYLPFEKCVALHLQKLESPFPGSNLCQVWLELAHWFWRSRLLKVVTLLLLFSNYLPFGKGVVLHLDKLESPSPKDALCQDWLKLAQWFWRRRFLKVVNLFLLFPIISPLGRAWPFNWTDLNPLYPGDILC